MANKVESEMENKILDISLKVKVTGEDIDDIMAGALEGGITYWCDRAEVVGDYLGEYASEQISRGGVLRLYDGEEEEWHRLTFDKFINGLRMYLENPHPYEITEYQNGEYVIDTCMADATVCDMIIQYALFGEVVFG